MDCDEFRRAAHQMVDYIIDYHENIRDRDVVPNVDPGYLKHLIPSAAPEESETWDEVMKDLDRVVMPGVTHWHSPRFHAYFPTAMSYPAILADMLSDAIGCIGFSWISSPACTELEVVMLDWLGKALHLPSQFLASESEKGGGVIQGTASEATLVALLSAKARTIQSVQKDDDGQHKSSITSKLVAYTSEQSHSSVERAGLLGDVITKKVPVDASLSVRGQALQEIIEADLKRGLIPCFCVATLGTTNTCAFDNLLEMGEVCNRYGIWLHVDAAYAGSSFVCPEFQHYLNGIERADSFNMNPHKWLLVNFDCSAMWFKDSTTLVQAFNVDPLYLKYDKQGQAPDYRHWQIPLGRRFRSLKLWFVLRLYGLKRLREYIRKHVALAKQFHDSIERDGRFEIVVPTVLGLVCFRLKGSNALNKALLKTLNKRGRIHLVTASVQDVYFLRMAVCAQQTTAEDMRNTWKEVDECARITLKSFKE